MKVVDFPAANMALGAGDTNENTIPIRVMLARHPQFKSKPDFYCGKFEYETDEIEALKTHFEEVIKTVLSAIPNGTFEITQLQQSLSSAVVEKMPPIWLMSMHSWAPKVVSVFEPQQLGYERVVIPAKPTDN